MKKVGIEFEKSLHTSFLNKVALRWSFHWAPGSSAQTGEQVCLVKINTRLSSKDAHDRPTRGQGPQGIWLLMLMTQHHPGGPKLKQKNNNGLLCVRNTDRTCPPQPPLPPFTLYSSFFLSYSFILSQTGREQGILIKGCQGQEGKKGACEDSKHNMMYIEQLRTGIGF